MSKLSTKIYVTLTSILSILVFVLFYGTTVNNQKISENNFTISSINTYISNIVTTKNDYINKLASTQKVLENYRKKKQTVSLLEIKLFLEHISKKNLAGTTYINLDEKQIRYLDTEMNNVILVKQTIEQSYSTLTGSTSEKILYNNNEYYDTKITFSPEKIREYLLQLKDKPKVLENYYNLLKLNNK